jgi:S-formylglutathione hydrolase FrmB
MRPSSTEFRTAEQQQRIVVGICHSQRMKLGRMLRGATLAVILNLCTWNVAISNADNIEYLMVPSPAMGRDIPVAFLAGGPHAVVLLDAFDAAPDVSNWVTAGNAMKTLAGKGITVIAPAGGAWSFYTNWQQDANKQWETFLSTELPDWLATNKKLAPGGHGVIGTAQGGTAAITLAEFHPDRYRYAGSMSGFLYPSETAFNGAITVGMQQFGGVDTRNMWGPAQSFGWKPHDPAVHVQLLVDNNTRLWIFSPTTLTCSDPPAMIGYCDQAQGSNRTFYQHYRLVGGSNAHADFPSGVNHDWSAWGPQLGELSGDLVATIR